MPEALQFGMLEVATRQADPRFSGPHDSRAPLVSLLAPRREVLVAGFVGSLLGFGFAGDRRDVGMDDVGEAGGPSHGEPDRFVLRMPYEETP